VTDHAVLIAAADLLPALKERLSAEIAELATFNDAEALRALEAITTRRPSAVVLERKFADTPRGSALINRIKADPALQATDIRVVSSDGRSIEPAAPPAPSSPPEAVQASAAPAPVEPAAELDDRGTRRAARYEIDGSAAILVDGTRGTLVDLSALGAQVLTATVLKPNQRVRVALTDDAGTVRCGATVVWAEFEIPKGAAPRYRVGLDFIAPDTAAIDAYAHRHRA
jgi:hypothetical protein